MAVFVYCYDPDEGYPVFSVVLTTKDPVEKLNKDPHQTERKAYLKVIETHPELEDLEIQWCIFWPGKP